MEEHIINLTFGREIPRTKKEAGIPENAEPLKIAGDFGKYCSPAYNANYFFPLHEEPERGSE